MIADTVYPIIQSLSKSEKLKLFKRLQKDLRSTYDIDTVVSEKKQRKAEMTKWLREHIFYPPKQKNPLLE